VKIDWKKFVSMKNMFVILIVTVLCGLSSFAQIAKCKGKYFGNVIGTSVPSNYGSLWNQVTPENGTKWGVVEKTRGTYDWTEADVSYNWAKNNGGLFKFHTFVWGSQMPDWVPDATTAELTASVENFMKAAAEHFEPMGGLELIDVLNEPANPVLPDYMITALTAGYKAEPTNANDLNNPYGWAIWPYQLARKYFPNATLLTNEYNIEQDWDDMRAPYITVINAIKKAPNLTNGDKNLIDGIGLQCHGVMDLTAENFKACLDEMWSGTGLPIHITEFDQAAYADEAKQKAVYSTLIPVAWEHSHVAGITLWGYIQGSTWIEGNGIAGPTGTDSGIQYSSTYAAKPGGDRPALTWLKQYLASQSSLACCPPPASLASCPVAVRPTISITTPSTLSLLPTTAPIPLTATASDADGTIASVVFYSGTKLLGTVTSSPYTYTWKNVAAGTYIITAVATDNSGLKATSKIVKITVAIPVTRVYQCNACTSPTWTTATNWAPAAVPSVIDTAVIRTGEVKVSASVASVTKVETNGIFRIMDSISATDLRLQGGTLKSYTSTPVFILTSTIAAEKASTVMAGSISTSTFRIDGTINGSGNLTKTGVGVLQVNANGANYKGTWIITAGKLKLRSATGLGQCGVEVDSAANLDVEAAASTNALVLKKGGTVNLDANLTVQVAIFNDKNIPAGTYKKASYPAFITGAGTLTVAKSLVVASAPSAGSITLAAGAGATFSWTSGSTTVSSTATYVPTATGVYTVKVTTTAGCVATSAPVYSQLIPLNKGWNLISVNLVPDSLIDNACGGAAIFCVSTLFAGLNVQEIKTMEAFWRPGQIAAFNSLTTITPGYGYLVDMNSAGKLMVAGTPNLEGFQNLQGLQAGWQLIGCPFRSATPMSDYFSLLNCSEIKNFDGFWIPDGSVNSIHDLEVGKGYFLKK